MYFPFLTPPILLNIINVLSAQKLKKTATHKAAAISTFAKASSLTTPNRDYSPSK